MKDTPAPIPSLLMVAEDKCSPPFNSSSNRMGMGI